VANKQASAFGNCGLTAHAKNCAGINASGHPHAETYSEDPAWPNLSASYVAAEEIMGILVTVSASFRDV